jgi:hypothetical protein
MLNFYDFEVFKYDWMVVIINPMTQKKDVIINDREKLIDFYEIHKNEVWVGWNSQNYDQFILKGILLDTDPKMINDCIIHKGYKGWKIDSRYAKIPLINYDCKFDKEIGLKQVEGFMGDNIHESSIPFDIDRKLTDAEIAETVKYCTNDVESTIKVFMELENEFNAQFDLIKTFNLPLANISKTQAQLASIILNAKKVKLDDEWNIRLPETLKLNKYKEVANWFMDSRNHFTDTQLTLDVAGVEHVFGWGGLHGAKEKYHYTCKPDELLVMADVDQLYPTLMIKYNLLSRAIQVPERFNNILQTSLRLKKERKKKEREPYKRICNIAYGAMGDKYNSLYDPLHRKLVCVYGQVLLLDLIEKIEHFAELIQSNTDGILIKIKRKDFDLLDDIIFEWEERTGLTMSFELYEKIIQKDVNNYIAVDFNNESKRKGSYVKKLSKMDNDLPIINKAVVECLVNGVSPEQTINNCDELIQFQKLVKISSKYKYGFHNGKQLNEKTFRVFASNDIFDSYIGKQKESGATIEKFANTPEHCFIDNGDIIGKKIPPKLSKRWYINLAMKRVEDYGYTMQTKLF